VADIKRKIDDMAGAAAAMPWIQQNIINGLKSGPVVVSLGRETRSGEQNNLLWALLTDISNQVTWFDKKHSPEAWKDIITGSFKGAEFVPNINGDGFVLLGMRTSKMDKPTFSALVDYIQAFGADQSIKWSDPSLAVFEQYREAKQ
jgi:hypothetical protein